MRYYPICLDIKKKSCLVVGGGRVALRKVDTLLTCGAWVSVVAQVCCHELQTLAADGRICLKEKPYDNGDLDGVFMVIGATDDHPVNMQVSRDANTRKIICNIADYPAACDFILPSIVCRKDLMISCLYYLMFI